MEDKIKEINSMWLGGFITAEAAMGLINELCHVRCVETIKIYADGEVVLEIDKGEIEC